ncbi:hypothetical protein [Gottfriedia acidiceleris]|uniref:Aminoglycoside phosphotransferase domain-containing protein n=1 Tax=Gottfriedia acidiceleris TaxID=371036 RepID=A0ABY4JPA8_9BACI|nr:hypothetical protein [Gottfriedia acidiceleris]UPM54155.1 hypothetical protein MY490_20835 [Gottfriedia acidiceleris]
MEEFTYIYIDNFLYSSLYINLEQSLIGLIFFLFFKGKPFGFLERETKIGFINFFIPIVRLIRVLEFAYLYYKKKRINKVKPGTFPTLSSSHYGNCLILVGHGEHKIVNLREQSVTTIFPNNFSRNVMEDKIYKLIEAQNCKLSQSLLDWNISNRFMKESYVNLKPACFNIQNVHTEALPILRDILFSKNYQVISLGQHLQNVTKRIDELLNPLLQEDFTLNNSIKPIYEFVSEINIELKKNCLKTEIVLGFTHGDFWEGNVLKSKKITKVIDWNTLEIRSSFFDLYFLIFEKFSNVSEKKLYEASEEFENVFHTFIRNYLEGNFINSEMAAILVNQSEIYRYIFYLEFILRKIKGNLKGERIYFEYLVERIKFFQAYESKLNENKYNNYIVEKIQ